MLFLFPHPAYNAGILLLVLVVAAVARLPFTKIQSIIAPLIPVFVLIVIITGYTYPTASFASDQARRVLFYSWPGHRLPVTVGGLLYGLTLFLRILTMVISSSIVTLTTPLDDFLQLMQICIYHTNCRLLLLQVYDLFPLWKGKPAWYWMRRGPEAP